MKFPHVVHFEAINSPNEHIRHLNQYMEVAPYLLGSESHTDLSCPLLRHPGKETLQRDMVTKALVNLFIIQILILVTYLYVRKPIKFPR